MMASSSGKTLRSPDSKDESKSTSPVLKFDALDFPGMTAMVYFDGTMKVIRDKMAADPAKIKLDEELRRSMPAAWINQEVSRNTLRQALSSPGFENMMQGLDNLMRENPQVSLESLGKPGALEQFAERVAQMRKDPDGEPILAEIDARGPAAVLQFGDDKDVLKKLGKSLISAFGDAEGLNYDEEEQVSQGRKALKIACGYAQMKCFKDLLDAQRRKANAVDRKKKKPSKRARLLPKNGDAV